jgi:Cu/Ag efflux protein CusF
MNKAITALISTSLIALAASCSPPTSEAPKADATPVAESMSVMPGMSAMPAVAAGPIRGVGAVTAITSTSVTIQHGPIDAIHWAAMKMEFTAENPAILKGVKVGDHVAFELKSVAEPQVVTAIEKQ